MNRNPSRGYTLIELLVSVAIFAIVMLSATAAYLSFISYNRQAQTTATVMNSLSFSVDTIARDIRTGSAYCTTACTASSFNFTDANGCSVTYALSGSSIVRTRGSGTNCVVENAAPITDSSITINSLKFYTRGTVSGPSDGQPIATIVIDGQATVPDSTTVIPFHIETSATERIPDL